MDTATKQQPNYTINSTSNGNTLTRDDELKLFIISCPAKAEYFAISSAIIKPYIRANPELIESLASTGDQFFQNWLVILNISLALLNAQKYPVLPRLDRDDLISEGLVGLVKASRNFDKTNGAKFSTYATHLIESTIKDALNANRLDVSMPIKMVKRLIELKAKSHEITIDGDDAIYLSYFDPAISLDASLDDDEDQKIEIRSDYKDWEPEFQTIRNEVIEQVRQSLNTLNQREREIIKDYYGIDRPEPLLQTDIANNYNISEERCRQIRRRAESKIKSQLSLLR